MGATRASQQQGGQGSTIPFRPFPRRAGALRPFKRLFREETSPGMGRIAAGHQSLLLSCGGKSSSLKGHMGTRQARRGEPCHQGPAHLHQCRVPITGKTHVHPSSPPDYGTASLLGGSMATLAPTTQQAPQPLPGPGTLTLLIGRQGRVTALLLHLPQDLQVALLRAPLPLLGGAGRGRALLPPGKGRAAPTGHFQEVLGRPDGRTSARKLVLVPSLSLHSLRFVV